MTQVSSSLTYNNHITESHKNPWDTFRYKHTNDTWLCFRWTSCNNNNRLQH